MSLVVPNKKNDVKQAIANERLEGLHVSETSVKIANKYIAGKISAKSAAAKIRARYGSAVR